MRYTDIFDHARNCISRWLIESLFMTPGAKWDNGEYWCNSPIRADRSPGSFHIGENGLWFDHATNEGGDLIKLVSRRDNITVKEAAKKIIEESGEQVEEYSGNRTMPRVVDNTPDELLFAPEEDEHAEPKLSKDNAQIPIPADVLPTLSQFIKRDFFVKKFGEPKRAWIYKTKDGAWCCVVRHEQGEEKQHVPYYYTTEGKWKAGCPYKTKRPLFGINKLEHGAKVLVVEGEKCASIVVPGYTVLTWLGGTGGVKTADWCSIKDYDVTIWPDNDEPGVQAAMYIKSLLNNAVILNIQDRPEKWDIADAIVDGVDPVEFIEQSKPVKKSEAVVNVPTSAGDTLTVPPDFIQMPQTEQIKAIIGTYVTGLRRNVITEYVEFKKGGMYKQLTDNDASDLQCRLMETRLMKNITERNFNLVMGSSFVPEYDPIKEYFRALPEWDGKDYIAELASFVEIKHDQFDENKDPVKTWNDYLRRWLIGCTAQMLGYGSNHTCLTLLGEQGVGKTTFLKNLGFDLAYTYVGAINPEDRDSKALYAQKALIVLDELESTTKRDMAALKSNMTLPEITIRLPYGRRSQVMKRLASFCACANNIDVLGDISGSRRWLCVETGRRIEFQKVTPEFMARVYSQCLALLNSGFQYWFDVSEINSLNENNSRFQEATAEHELLYKYYEKTEDKNAKWLTATEILSEISSDFKAQKLSLKKIGHLLKKGNFVRVKRHGLYGYLVQDRDIVPGLAAPSLPLEMDDPFSDDKIPI